MQPDSLTFRPDVAVYADKLFVQLIRSADEVPPGLTEKKPVPGTLNSGDGHVVIQTRFSSSKSIIPSVFGKHMLTPKVGASLPRELPGFDWAFFVLLACVIAAVAARFIYHKRFSLLVRSFFVPRIANQLIREGNIKTEGITLTFRFIYFTILSLVIFKAANASGIISGDIPEFLAIVLFLIVFGVAKNLLIRLAGFVFKTTKETDNYLNNNIIFSSVAGIFLLPLCFLMFYFPEFLSGITINIVLIVLGLFLLYRLVRNFLTGITSDTYGLYYLFLYFCTVEILPWVVIVKLLTNYYLKGFWIL